MLKLITVAALAAAFAGTASEAQGPATAGTYSVAIRSADLNLASPGGLATFRGRVHAAAAQACGDEKVAPLAEATQIAQCRAGFARAADYRVGVALTRQDTVVAGTR